MIPVIVYNSKDGDLRVIHPTKHGVMLATYRNRGYFGDLGVISISLQDTFVSKLSENELSKAIHSIAKKDVPFGLSYKIVNTSDLPNDRFFRDAWELEDLELTDGKGSDSNLFEALK